MDVSPDGLLTELSRRSLPPPPIPGSASQLHWRMSVAQCNRYRDAIVAYSASNQVVTPETLLGAAYAAIGADTSSARFRVGLQPGTMNPVHVGHVSMALASLLDFDLQHVLMAPGGSVPDKPDSAPTDVRHRMLLLALRGYALNQWITATRIRARTAQMFDVAPLADRVPGGTPEARRALSDIAGFAWLIRANPGVSWVYIVGADKVRGYGPKNERALIVDTLGRADVKAAIVYYAREGHDLDVECDIAPYPWLFDQWRQRRLQVAPRRVGQISSVAVRTAIASGDDRIDGFQLSQYVHPVVVDYIRSNPALISSYERELRRASKEPP
jgi:hypothetical protein